MLLRVDGRLGGRWLTSLAGVVGRAALLGVRGIGLVGWRLGAGACGVVFAGWLGGQALTVLDAAADVPSQPIAPPTVTGALRNASLGSERPDWAIVPRQPQSFAIGLNDIDGQPLQFTARRDLNSPLREELIRAGAFDIDKTSLLLSFQRQHSGAQVSFFVDVSRVMTDAGLAPLRTSQPTPLTTKFGIVEAADVSLSDGVASRACLVFRHIADGPSLRLQGWMCGTDKRPADRQQLVCLLDRATLVSAGEDRDLRAWFTKAELNRQPGCHVPKHQTAGRRANWLDADQSAPRMRRTGG